VCAAIAASSRFLPPGRIFDVTDLIALPTREAARATTPFFARASPSPLAVARVTPACGFVAASFFGLLAGAAAFGLGDSPRIAAFDFLPDFRAGVLSSFLLPAISHPFSAN